MYCILTLSILDSFWIAAGLSIAIGLTRICFPESKQFLETKKNGHKKVTPWAFWRDTKAMLAQEWTNVHLLHHPHDLVQLLQVSFPPHPVRKRNPDTRNHSHTSQDSYTTFMRQAKGLNNAAASRASSG